MTMPCGYDEVAEWHRRRALAFLAARDFAYALTVFPVEVIVDRELRRTAKWLEIIVTTGEVPGRPGELVDRGFRVFAAQMLPAISAGL